MIVCRERRSEFFGIVSKKSKNTAQHVIYRLTVKFGFAFQGLLKNYSIQ